MTPIDVGVSRRLSHWRPPTVSLRAHCQTDSQKKLEASSQSPVTYWSLEKWDHCCDVANLFWKTEVDSISEQSTDASSNNMWLTFLCVVSTTSRSLEFTLLIRNTAKSMSINDNSIQFNGAWVPWQCLSLTLYLQRFIHNRTYCDSIKAEHNFDLCSWWDHKHLLFGSTNIFSHCAVNARIPKSISRVWAMCP